VSHLKIMNFLSPVPRRAQPRAQTLFSRCVWVFAMCAVYEKKQDKRWSVNEAWVHLLRFTTW